MLLLGGEEGILPGRACSAPASVLWLLCISSPFTIIRTGTCHSVDEETEAQRDEVTCRQCYGQEVAELGSGARTLNQAGPFRAGHDERQ